MFAAAGKPCATPALWRSMQCCHGSCSGCRWAHAHQTIDTSVLWSLQWRN